jgi:copper chaperone CopZ
MQGIYLHTANLKTNTMIKLLSGAFAIILLSTIISCSGNGKSTGSGNAVQEISRIEVSIAGMTCTGCEQTIQRNVGKLDGVKSVQASYKEGKALVEYVPSVADTAGIRSAITRSGYTVVSFSSR